MQLVCPFSVPLAAARLAAIAAVGGYFNTVPKVRLYTNNPSISSTSVVADFTEATFSGYSQCVADDVPDVVYDVETGLWTMMLFQASPGFFFQCNGGTPQTVNGLYVVSNDASKLLGAAPFQTPLYFGKNKDALQVGSIKWQWKDDFLG